MADLDWLPATVPGTVAAALRAAGRWDWDLEDRQLLDGNDWWYRGWLDVPALGGPWVLRCEGLATLCDIWVDGAHVLRSSSMWSRSDAPLTVEAGRRQIVMRFAALALPPGRRPRPRWRTRLVDAPELRWLRTSLTGRMPGWASQAAPVGPWRPLTLCSAAPPRVADRAVSVRADGDGGAISMALQLDGIASGAVVEVRCGDHRVSLDDSPAGATGAPSEPGRRRVEGRLTLPEVRRWWPHTHGSPDRHRVEIVVDDDVVDRLDVGFRELSVDRSGGGFTLRVNGTPVFCRGASWALPDLVSLEASEAVLRPSLEALRDSGANLLRLSGVSHYQPPLFWDLCDELGLLVWQDCMLASYDPPEDAAWVDSVAAEVAAELADIGWRPSLAVIAGGNETQQQPAMLGLPPDRYRSTLLDEVLPGVVERGAPGVPYLPSAPTGGDPPFDPGTGVAHYFGVGAYRRPLSDARLTGVRFAAECLAFATPPEPSTIEELFGDPAPAGHSPQWKRGVPRDPGAPWDFEDVVAFYVTDRFGVDLPTLRSIDPAKALDAARAAVCEAVEGTFGEWRRPTSGCGGGLVLCWQDVRPGAGWGLTDVFGRPKAPAWVLRRLWAPVAVWVTDEGLSGLHVHLANDGPGPIDADLRVQATARDGVVVLEERRPVSIAARSGSSFSEAELTGAFRDLSGAYRFGVPAHDAVTVELCAGDGTVLSRCVHVAGWVRRVDQADPGLAAVVAPTLDGGWELTLSSTSLACWVAIDLPGWEVPDNWFHLPAGLERRLPLRGHGNDPAGQAPRGSVRALNGARPVQVRVAERGPDGG